jgi:hypothetical protein
LKHIKRETTDASFPGIPIYVDPAGLIEVKTKIETQVVINQKQKPVRLILNEALMGTGLSFIVRNGFMSIDSRIGITEWRVEQLDRKLNQVLEALDRLAKAK